MIMTVKEAAAQCTPGSTNFSSCVMNKSGKMVADWATSSIHQNEVTKAYSAVLNWVYFVGRGYKRFLADEYFDYIPVSIINEVFDNEYFTTKILQRAAQYNVDLPDFIDELIAKD